MVKVQPEISWDLINCFAVLCFVSFLSLSSTLSFVLFISISPCFYSQQRYCFSSPRLVFIALYFLSSFLYSFLPSIHPSFFTLFFFLSIATKLSCFLVLPFCRLFFFSDAFAKLWKATISFVMSVHLSVLPSARMEQPDSHRENFHEISYMSIFRESDEKKSNFL